jgi:predicted nucleic acid-binding protein
LTYLLDTNVACEPTSKTPDPKVMAWLTARGPDELFLSAVTVAEIRYGVEAAPSRARRRALELWYAEAIAARPEFVLPIGLEVADAWGRLRRRAEQGKHTMPAMDAFIAATAQVYGLTLVTRNVRDFEAWEGAVFNPWTDPSPGGR